MKVFVPQFKHINKSVLPLRFGVSITQTHQSFCELTNYQYDDEGTKRQRGDEKSRGNKHYLGTLIVNNEDRNDQPINLKGRFVISPPREGHERDVVVTALREDIENLKSDIAVTKHLEGMLKRGRVTTQEIIEYFHPEYMSGKINESNDLEDVFQNLIRPIKAQALPSVTKADQGILESADEIIASIDELELEGKESGSKNEVSLNRRRPLTFKPLHLKPSVKFEYVMAEAYVVDAGRTDGKVWVECINSKGETQRLQSFTLRSHLAHHHDHAAQYLVNQKGERAFFAICVSPQYEGVLAESVTSIALQLMQQG